MQVNNNSPPFKLSEQFNLMTRPQQAITVIAGIFVTFLSLGSLTYFVLKKIVKNFREIENSKMNETQSKTGAIYKKTIEAETNPKTLSFKSSKEIAKKSLDTQEDVNDVDGEVDKTSHQAKKIEKKSLDAQEDFKVVEEKIDKTLGQAKNIEKKSLDAQEDVKVVDGEVDKTSHQAKKIDDKYTFEEKKEILIKYFWQEVDHGLLKQMEVKNFDGINSDLLIKEFIKKRRDRLGNNNFDVTGEYLRHLRAHINSVKSYNKDKDSDLTSEERKFVLDGKQSKPSQKIKFPYTLPSKEVVCTIQTRGDGSCGFHALLGKKENKYVVCDQVSDIRRNFCVRLNKLFKEEKLPTCITTQLIDIYQNPSNKDYKEIVRKIVRKKSKASGNNKKSLKDLFKKEDDFVKDPLVFVSYLEQLKETTYYISQQELEAAAIVFNKRVRLFQDGWGNDSKKLTEETLNPDGAEEVSIYYSPANKHYERVEINKKKLDS